MATLVGVGIGLLSGLLGIGGGAVMVPMFRLVFGLPPVVSTATSLLTIIPTTVSGVVAHVRSGTCLPKLGIAMGIGGALTSPLGAWLSTVSPTWLVMLTVSIIIAYSAVTMLRKALKPAGGASGAAGSGAAGAAGSGAARSAAGAAGAAGSGAAGTTGTAGSGAASSCAAGANAGSPNPNPDPGPELSGSGLVKAGVIGMVAGLFSGYVGLGGGFIMVPMMVALLKMPMRLASGTSLIAVMILATPGALTQIALGNVDFAVALACAIGAIPGAFVGAKLVNRVPERKLRLMFAGFLLVGAILLVVKELGVLG